MTDAFLVDSEIEKSFIYVLSVIDRPESQEQKELAELLSLVDHAVLKIFVQKSQRIKAFCSTHPDFLHAIEKKLRDAGHVYFEVNAMDGISHYSLLELYLAAGRMTTFANNRDRKERALALEAACELGLYDALLVQSMIMAKIVSNQDLPVEKREKAIDDIEKLTSRLCNLYWGIGYVQAGCVFYALGNYFHFLEDPTENQRSANFFERAATYFLSAELLRQHLYSNTIIHHLTREQGIFSVFEKNHIDCQSWDAVHSFCQELMQARFHVAVKLAYAEVGYLVRLTPD